LTGIMVTLEGGGQQLLSAHYTSRAGTKWWKPIAPNDKTECGSVCQGEKELIIIHLRKPSRDKCWCSGLAAIQIQGTHEPEKGIPP
jgi:hypothetical protein